jgi:hypothetical protein
VLADDCAKPANRRARQNLQSKAANPEFAGSPRHDAALLRGCKRFSLTMLYRQRVPVPNSTSQASRPPSCAARISRLNHGHAVARPRQRRARKLMAVAVLPMPGRLAIITKSPGQIAPSAWSRLGMMREQDAGASSNCVLRLASMALDAHIACAPPWVLSASAMTLFRHARQLGQILVALGIFASRRHA